KYIQDAIRHSRIINDDDWQHVSNTSLGFTDDFNHTQVFVVDNKNYVDFMNELLTNDEKYKCIECIKNNKQSFIETAKKEEMEKQKTDKNNAFSSDKKDDIFNL